MLIVNEKNVIASIITISFNDLNNLKKTISLFSSYKGTNNIELIVVDGGSTDGTIEYLNNNSHLVDQWVSEPDDGIGDAWNKGFRLSKGRVFSVITFSVQNIFDSLSINLQNLILDAFFSKDQSMTVKLVKAIYQLIQYLLCQNTCSNSLLLYCSA
jgi:glycosyltransferase involved in cell wall biosynthesis